MSNYSGDNSSAKAETTAATTNATEEEDNAAARKTTTIETKVKKRVRFSHLDIREYPIVLGDNPTPKLGPPVSIGWDHCAEIERVDVDLYESVRPPRRDRDAALKLPAAYRVVLLKRQGYAASEIADGMRKAEVAKRQRKRTVELLRLEPFDEGAECLSRRAANIASLGAAQRKEREFLQPYSARGAPGKENARGLATAPPRSSRHFRQTARGTGRVGPSLSNRTLRALKVWGEANSFF